MASTPLTPATKTTTYSKSPDGQYETTTVQITYSQNDANNQTVDNAPPPSYDSLYDKMKNARETSSGPCEFLKNLFTIIRKTVGWTIVTALTMIIPLSMLVIGSIYLYDCPLNDNIPIYLVVAGAVQAFLHLLDIACNKKKRNSNDDDEEQEKENSCLKGLKSISASFLFVWLICGSVWVYREYEPNYAPEFGKYCHKTVYLFAFWIITLTYIFYALVILLGCAILSLAACMCFGSACLAGKCAEDGSS